MPKKWLRKWLPHPSKIKSQGQLQVFSKFLGSENLWHLNRHSVARGTAIGLFCCFLPIPFQMVVAAAFAILFQANILISVLLVWISNPLTMPVMFYVTYKLGTLVLHVPAKQNVAFTFTLDWFQNQLSHILLPLLTGSLLCGIASAIIAYFGIHFIWRVWVRRAWQLRKR